MIAPGTYTRQGAIIGRRPDGSALHDEPDVVTVLTGKPRRLVYDFEPEPCVRVSFGTGGPAYWVALRVLTPATSEFGLGYMQGRGAS